MSNSPSSITASPLQSQVSRLTDVEAALRQLANLVESCDDRNKLSHLGMAKLLSMLADQLEPTINEIADFRCAPDARKRT